MLPYIHPLRWSVLLKYAQECESFRRGNKVPIVTRRRCWNYGYYSVILFKLLKCVRIIRCMSAHFRRAPQTHHIGLYSNTKKTGNPELRTMPKLISAYTRVLLGCFFIGSIALTTAAGEPSCMIIIVAVVLYASIHSYIITSYTMILRRCKRLATQ